MKKRYSWNEVQMKARANMTNLAARIEICFDETPLLYNLEVKRLHKLIQLTKKISV